MATLKIDIQKAINPYWLIQNGYTILLPKNKVHTIRLVAILWGNLKEDTTRKKINELLKCTEGLSQRTYFRLARFEFAFNETTVGKKIYNDKKKLDKFQTDTFTVEVRENATNLTKYHFRINLKQAEEFLIKNETILDPKEVKEMRDNIINAPAKLEISGIEDKEKLALDICKTIATGQFSIQEACERYNVRYLEFAEWYGENQYIQQMLAEARLLSEFFNSSLQASRVNKLTNELLMMGRTYTETIHYKKVYNNMNPGGIWVEDSKTVQHRQLDLKDMVLMQQMLKSQPLPQFTQDEIDSMSNDELFSKYEEYRQRMINELNTRK